MVIKPEVSAAQKKVPPVPLGDNLSGTAGQKTLRDAPVVLKLRRKVAAFFGYFLLLLTQRSLLRACKASRRVSEANQK